MKIVQLNIWHGKLGDSVIRFLNNQDADIVCLQEVSEMTGPTAGMFVPLHEIQEQTGFEHLFFAPTVTYTFMKRSCQYGNAILSKFPLKQQATTFITGRYREDFDRTEGDYNMRNLQTCQVHLPGQTITLVNHHGYHIQNPDGDGRSLQALQKVADILKAIDGPLIFCGDLNVSPHSPAFAPLKNLRLTNLTAEHRLSSTLSRAHKLDLPIACDYILVSPDIHVTDFATSDEIVSDHKPLVMEFNLA